MTTTTMATQMRTILHTAAAAALMLLAATGCAPKEKSDKAVEREQWLASLNDSIATYKKQIDSTQQRLDALNEESARLLERFDYIENPREVEGYYLLKGWQGRHPANATWLYARISKSEGLELLASLKGGVFTSVAALSGGESAETAAVAPDQALNFRHKGYNTVCFYGAEADSVAAFIAAHEGDDVTIEYLNPGRSGSLKLSADQRAMIAETWRLYDTRRQIRRLEKEMPMLSRRIDACRLMMERDSTTSK